MFPSMFDHTDNSMFGRIAFGRRRDQLSWVSRACWLCPEHGQPDSMVIYPYPGIIDLGDTIRGYYTGFTTGHGAVTGGYVMAWELRRDGFVSLSANGAVTTRLLTFSGTSLYLNVDARLSSGGVRVALLGADGKPLSGHSFAESDPLTIDAVDAVATWGGESALGVPHGTAVQVSFQLSAGASLYAFGFR